MLLFPFICFQLDIVEFIPSLLYFGYTTLMVLSFWLLTGTIGFYAAYMFIRKIYAAVKIDWAVTDAAVLGFCWCLFYFVHILYFNVYNSILYVQRALIECRGNQEGWDFFFLGTTAPPTGVMGKNSKVAKSHQLLLSLFSLFLFFPNLSRTETLEGLFSTVSPCTQYIGPKFVSRHFLQILSFYFCYVS